MNLFRNAASALIAAGLSWGQAPSAPAKGPDIRVARSVVCTAVKDREPVDGQEAGKPAEFKADIGRVIFWTEVFAKTPPISVRHVWYAGGKKIGEVRLEVKGARARTWSSQRVWTGDWKVETASDSGEVLSSAQFKVNR